LVIFFLSQISLRSLRKFWIAGSNIKPPAELKYGLKLSRADSPYFYDYFAHEAEHPRDLGVTLHTRWRFSSAQLDIDTSMRYKIKQPLQYVEIKLFK
jgi:hypothetical protein